MKKIILLILVVSLSLLSCSTPKICNSYTDHYSKKLVVNDYCNGSKVDRKRKKIFEEYLKYSRKRNGNLITIEFLTKNPDLEGYSIYFVNNSEESFTVMYYKPINTNKVRIKEKSFSYNNDLRLLDYNYFVRYIWKNGLDFELKDFENNRDFMLDFDFGKTIITEYDTNNKVLNSRTFDSVIYLAYLKDNADF